MWVKKIKICGFCMEWYSKHSISLVVYKAEAQINAFKCKIMLKEVFWLDFAFIRSCFDGKKRETMISYL